MNTILIALAIIFAPAAPQCTVEDASSGPTPCVHDGIIFNYSTDLWVDLTTGELTRA